MAKFSLSLVNDILDTLEQLGIEMSAIDYMISTDTPERNLEWNVSTINIGDTAEHLDRMHGVLESIRE